MNNKNCEKIINYLLNKGFSDIKIIYIQKEKHTDTLKNDNINYNSIIENGISINFNYNDKQYFIASSEFDNIKNIKKKINILVKSNKNSNQKFKLTDDVFSIIASEFEKFNVDEFQKQLIKFIDECKNKMNISIPLLYERKRTFIVSPNNKSIYKEEFYYKMDIIVNAIIEKVNRFNYFSESCVSSLDTLNKINVYEELKRLYGTLLKMKSIDNINQKSAVVLSKGIGGILIHESCGHSLESRELIKKTSVFCGINNVHNNEITIMDNPRILKKFGSFEIDDEGNESKCKCLIRKGKIEEYLCDENGNRYLKQKNSSSGRRESYYNVFSSRMSNTYIEEGKYNFDDIINSIKEGYYVKNILGGVVDTISGNFSFNCLETYKIINGSIDYSTCYDNLTIIGNSLDVLKNITMIGNDLKFNCGICGSESGFVYTTVGQPTIKIDNILMVS